MVYKDGVRADALAVRRFEGGAINPGTEKSEPGEELPNASYDPTESVGSERHIETKSWSKAAFTLDRVLLQAIRLSRQPSALRSFFPFTPI